MWTPIIQALVTALLSGLFSGGIIFALNERRDRQKLLHEKAEAAIEVYSEWAESVPTWCLTHWEMFLTDRAQGRRNCFESFVEMRAKFLRARALVWIYLPDNKEVLQRIQNRYQPLADIRMELVRMSLAGENLSDANKAVLNDVAREVTMVAELGLRELIAATQKHALPPHLVRLPTFRRKSKTQAKAASE